MNSPRILIIEDDTSIRESLAFLLQLENFEVLEAAHGAEGLEQLRRHQDIQLMLLDLSMPVMDGYEFLSTYHQEFTTPPQANVPIVVMSALASHQTRLAGVRSVVPKPFQVDELLAKVREILPN